MKTGKYATSQRLNAKALLSGSRCLPLEIPEITDEEGTPSIVFLKPLPTKVVLSFSHRLSVAAKAQEKAKKAGLEVDDSDESTMNEMIELIRQAVTDEEGSRLFSQDDDIMSALDMRLFNRLSRALTNMINGKDLDYVEPPKPEAPPCDESCKCPCHTVGKAPEPAEKEATTTS